MTTDVRVPRPDEWDEWYGMPVLALGGVDESPEGRVLRNGLTEFDRFIGAWDCDECVGTAAR